MPEGLLSPPLPVAVLDVAVPVHQVDDLRRVAVFRVEGFFQALQLAGRQVAPAGQARRLAPQLRPVRLTLVGEQFLKQAVGLRQPAGFLVVSMKFPAKES